MPGFRESSSEEIRDAANAWVARFAPLLMNQEVLTESEVRKRIYDSEILQREGRDMRERVREIAETDPDLIKTFEAAVGQLDSIEMDYRKQLALLKPGDPDGIANLETVNEKLQERLARQEVGLETNPTVPSILDLKVSPGNKAAAAGLFVFGLGWNAFTAFHATLMIGGMSKAFGLGAFALLAFYAIFFLVGFGMWAGAFHAGAAEQIHLDGRQLIITRTFGPYKKEKRYSLPPNSQAEIALAEDTQITGKNQTKKLVSVVQLHDVEGHPINIGAMATDMQRRQTLEKINAYLKVRG